MSQAGTGDAIELRLRDVSQLFHSLDPSSFRNRDLAEDAAAYILDWARELPKHREPRIVLHLPAAQVGEMAAADIGGAVRAYFRQRAGAESRAIREQFRSGRYALAIGLAILAVCLFTAWYAASLSDRPVSTVLQESFVILGWVAIWRPIEIFLYGWIPHAKDRSLFQRLSMAAVTLVGESHEGAPA